MFLLIPLLLIIALTACRPHITCEDTGCASGLICHAESGECVTKTDDCRHNPGLCAPNESCDSHQGICRPQSFSCTLENPCPDGQTCNAQSGFCEPDLKCSINGCLSHQTCNPSTERCVPRPCTRDAECPTEFICEETCQPGCRPNQGGCAPGESCIAQTHSSLGTCQPRCQTHTDCPFGQICTHTGAASECTPEPPCAADNDCRSDEICRLKACVQPPCSHSDDCSANQICEIPSGMCIQTHCQDDVYGTGLFTPPNHTPEHAARLPAASACISNPTPRCVYENLVLCPASSDWFVSRISSSESLRIRVDQLQENPDIDLYVYDENLNEIARHTLLTTVSTLRIDATRTQDIHIEIRPVTYSTAHYTLTLTRDFCPDDLFEENDSMQTATRLDATPGVFAEVQATSCGLDEDWFLLPQLSAENALRISRGTSEISLVVEAWLPNHQIINIGRNQELDILRLHTPGATYLRIYNGLGLSSNYQFGYEIQPRWVCSGSGQHNTQQNARQPETRHDNAVLCPLNQSWDTHWWKLPGFSTLKIIPALETPELKVELFSAPNTPLRTAVRTLEGWELRGNFPEAFLKVSSDAPLKTLTALPGYTLSYE